MDLDANRKARVAVVPVDGAWKIRTVDIIDEVRVQ